MFQYLIASAKSHHSRRRYFAATMALWVVSLMSTAVYEICAYDAVLREPLAVDYYICSLPPPPPVSSPVVASCPGYEESASSCEAIENSLTVIAPTTAGNAGALLPVHQPSAALFTQMDSTVYGHDFGCYYEIPESDPTGCTCDVVVDIEIAPIPPPPPVEPPAELGTPQITKCGEGVIRGRAIERYIPDYPALARAYKVQGDVIVEIIMDEQGRVIKAIAISGAPLLRGAAQAAARQWRFSITYIQERPVKRAAMAVASC